jgi:tRNA(fMet)-specific endonuclease VapC
MKYLLDTCVVSDFIKGEKNTLSKIREISPLEISVSSITVMEIYYGLALNPLRAKKIKDLTFKFLDAINFLTFNKKDAEQAAIIRALLKEQGTPIGPYDVLLAGTALNHELILVTANTKEFNRIPNLQIENWR